MGDPQIVSLAAVTWFGGMLWGVHALGKDAAGQMAAAEDESVACWEAMDRGSSSEWPSISADDLDLRAEAG